MCTIPVPATRKVFPSSGIISCIVWPLKCCSRPQPEARHTLHLISTNHYSSLASYRIQPIIHQYHHTITQELLSEDTLFLLYDPEEEELPSAASPFFTLTEEELDYYDEEEEMPEEDSD